MVTNYETLPIEKKRFIKNKSSILIKHIPQSLIDFWID